MRLWQRVLFVAIVLGALVVGAGLIYYGPRVQTAAPSGRATPATIPTAGPRYPPGVDEYYYWGQSQPLSQQP
jgi:hypothetical protein